MEKPNILDLINSQEEIKIAIDQYKRNKKRIEEFLEKRGSDPYLEKELEKFNYYIRELEKRQKEA